MPDPVASRVRKGISPDRPDRGTGRTTLAESPAGWRPLEVRRLGRVEYGDALRMQEELVQRRRAGLVGDLLLFVEHSHVITLGTVARVEHVLLDPEERRLLGVELFETGRGGDATYHGPGQLVGYPILDLKPDRRDLHAYVRDLEEVLIRTVSEFGITGERRAGLSGVWVGENKIAAIGVRVSSGWITSHGFALNVNTDLSHFGVIVPCGIAGRGVTSLAQELGQPVPLADVGEAAAQHLAALLGSELRWEPALPELSAPEQPLLSQ